MTYTTLLKQGENLALWIYKNITSKFTSMYSKIKDRFPIFESHPLLKYSLIPILIFLFVGLRYIIKFVVNEVAAWTSSFVGETSGLNISEGTIVISIAASFILLRVVLQLRNRRNKTNV
ncbi:MAG TPA: hypothetical protein VJY12_10025 [Dysgonamonadaceae bacterium]|nr:hypothetical protein [Dysgonamonadaceae bacterium]